MCDWDRDWSGDVLERIVALLFALANLADLASDAPFLRRRQVLGILSYGEAEGRAFVIGMISGASVAADTLEHDGNAARLAVRLRALALMLYAMLARRSALSGADGSHAGRPLRRNSGVAVSWPDASPPPAPDTS